MIGRWRTDPARPWDLRSHDGARVGEGSAAGDEDSLIQAPRAAEGARAKWSKAAVSRLLALMLALSVIVSGCWDARDPKTLDLAESVGFQQVASGQGLAMLAQVPTASFMAGLLPSAQGGGGGGSQPPSFTMAATGQTVPIAVKNLDALTGKAIYLGQVRALFVSAGLARAGLTNLADQLLQMPSIPQGAPLVVVDGQVGPLLQANLAGTNLAGRFIDLYFRTTAPSAVSRVPMWLFFVDLYTPGVAPTLPVFRLQSIPGGRATMEAEGTAVFRGGHMVDVLTGRDGQGLLLWKNDFVRQVFQLSSAIGGVTVDDVGAVTIFDLRAVPGGLPVLEARVHVTGAIHAAPPFLSPADIELLQQDTSEYVQQEMEDTLAALQRQGADAIGAGTWLHYHDPAAFARLQPWARTFAQLEVDLRVTTSLTTTGWGS